MISCNPKYFKKERKHKVRDSDREDMGLMFWEKGGEIFKPDSAKPLEPKKQSLKQYPNYDS